MANKLSIRVLNSDVASEVRVVGQDLAPADLPISPFHFPHNHIVWGQPEKNHIAISLSPLAHNQIMQHGRNGGRLEVGGFLLGKVFLSPDKKYHVSIERSLPDLDGISHAASFMFTHESWANLVAEAGREFPDLVIVGWYHTHPDLGAFFSGTDRTTQRTYFNTFNSYWRVGLVVDPIRNEGAFFTANPRGNDVLQISGFYELLGRNGESTIAWRNWPMNSPRTSFGSTNAAAEVGQPIRRTAVSEEMSSTTEHEEAILRLGRWRLVRTRPTYGTLAPAISERRLRLTWLGLLILALLVASTILWNLQTKFAIENMQAQLTDLRVKAGLIDMKETPTQPTERETPSIPIPLSVP